MTGKGTGGDPHDGGRAAREPGSGWTVTAAQIAEAAHEPLLVLEEAPGLRVLAANRAFYGTFRAAPGATLGRSVYELNGGRWDTPAVRRLLEEVLPRDGAFDGLEVAVNEGGPAAALGPAVRLNARRVPGDGGGPGRLLLALLPADGGGLTGAAALQAAALHESEQRYRLMAREVIDYAIFSLDPEGRIVTWSEGARRMKQYTEDDVLGEHFRMLYPEEDRERKKPERELEVVLRDGRLEDFGWRRRKDGSLFWADVVITAMRDPRGELIGFGKVVRDLTEAKRFAENRERLRELETGAKVAARERAFLRQVLLSVTDKRLRLCDGPGDLPARGAPLAPPVLVTEESLWLLRQAAEGAARTRGFPDERAQDLLTAVGEAGMNAVVHGGGRARGQVCAGGTRVNPTVQVWVEDAGGGIPLEQLPRATLEKGHSTAGSLGHGFFLMLRTVDRVWLLTGPGGTTVVLEQDRTPPEPGPVAPGGRAGPA